MARIRSIKPDFFLDYPLAKLDPRVRLFFIGLWCQADKAGRLRDEPEKLKVQILPWDDIAAETCLVALTPSFIVRYEAEGLRLIQVKSWRHQKPHHTESPSVLPPPTQEAYTVETPLIHGLEGKGEGGGKGSGNGEGEAVRAQAPLPPTSQAVMTFPVVGKGEAGQARLWALTEAKLAEYLESFPAVDVLAECRKARQWCIDRPANRKTYGGMPAFLSRWLGKEQDRGGRPGGFAKAPKPQEAGFTPGPLDYVILAYRDALEIPEKDRKAWNAAYWEGCRRDAQALLDYFEGDWRRAQGCVKYFVGEFRGKGLSVTLSTVMKHAHDYKNGRRG